MQIHELNTYGGNLDSGAYLAIDDGNDTGKVSALVLLSETAGEIARVEDELNGRIDNIIAGGDAPSAAEVTDARQGVNGAVYPSLGDAIRGQVESLENKITEALDSQRNLFFEGTIGATTFKDVPVSFPAGSYKVQADGFVSSDTDASVCRVMYMYNDTTVNTIDYPRNVAIDGTLNLSSQINKVRIYAATNYSNSLGDEFTVTNLRYSQGSELNDRLETSETKIEELLPLMPAVGIFPSTSGTAKSAAQAYARTTVVGGLVLKKERVYSVTFSIAAAVGAPVYVYLRDANTNVSLPGGGNTIPAGQTSVTYDVISDAEYENAKLCFEVGYASFTVSASIREVQTEDNITAISDNFDKLVNTGTYLLDINSFKVGGLISGVINTTKYRVVTYKTLYTDRALTLNADAAFKFSVHRYYEGAWHDPGWYYGTYTIPAGSTFRMVIARVTEDTSETADVKEFVSAISAESYLLENIEGAKGLNENINVIGNIFRFGKYFSHIGVDKNDDIIIPCQSIADVARAKRLGFKVMEINVRMTSDGKYVCLHGIQGAFGYQFKDINGNSVESVMVNSMTLQQIKNTIRYRSIYPKYQTAPYTLQEILLECKRQNIVPLVEYQPSYTDEVEILDSIMGKNNYILSVYSTDRGNISDAMLSSWLTISDPTALVAKCETSGGMYIAGLNVTASAYSEFTDTDWTNLISAVHEAGYLLGFVSAYTGEPLSQRLLGLGFDVSGSGWNINDIEVGNLCNLFAETDFADFITDGSVSNGLLSLSIDDTVKPNATLSSVFLGGGDLRIRFNGTIHLKFGDYIDANFTSDGSEEMQFTTFFEESVPTFEITAATNTSVYDIVYKASRM